MVYSDDEVKLAVAPCGSSVFVFVLFFVLLGCLFVFVRFFVGKTFIL